MGGGRTAVKSSIIKIPRGYGEGSVIFVSDVRDVTFPTSADADADVRLLTSADADADLHNPKQNACVTIEFSEI